MKKILHLISNAHLDPVWLWPVRDGMAEVLTTIQSAVDRAAEYPQFKFTRSTAALYRWVKEMDPALYQKIKDLVAAGRWEIVGGWVEQPDCNLPSTESFIRQGTEGLGFFEREFGKSTKIGYNVDSFGHAGGLPQILQGSGMTRYAFMRSGPGDDKKFPMLFWWESPDGSRVLTQRVPMYSYAQPYSVTEAQFTKTIRRAAVENFAPGFDNGVFWMGVGNHGGGPTRMQIDKVLEWQKDPTLPELRFSSLEDYFNAVQKEKAASQLPVVRKELGFCFRGCYSATGAVKAMHRASEKALYTAESLGVLEPFEAGVSTWPDRLAPLWWKLLFNQFHDILAGTCTLQTFDETQQRFGHVLDESRDLAIKAAYRMARRVDTSREKGSLLFAFNPLPWSRQVMVHLDTFTAPHGNEGITHLEDQSGKPIPIQWLRSDSNFGPCAMGWWKLSATVELPATGYCVFRAVMQPMADLKKIPNAPIYAEGRTPVLKTRVTREPALASCKGGQERELLAAPVDVVVIKDGSGTWGNAEREFREELGRPKIFSTRVIEDGPQITVTRQKSRWRSSEIWMDVIRRAYTPHVEMRFRINWQEKRQIAKLEISTRLAKTSTLAKTAGGTTRRETQGEEFPCQDWVRLEGSLRNKTAAVALVNDSSYSFEAKDGLLRMILVRSVPFAEHHDLEYQDDSNVAFLDQGWQERRFLLVGGADAQSAGMLDRLAQEFQVPALTMLDSIHPGAEPWEMENLSVEPAGVSVLAVKPAVDGRGFILRLQEVNGIAQKAKIRWRKMTAGTVDLAPYKIISLRVVPSRQGVKISPVDFHEKEVRVR